MPRHKGGVARLAVSLPVGSGKTVVFAELIRRLRPAMHGRRTRTLVLAHRAELLAQAEATVRDFDDVLARRLTVCVERLPLESMAALHPDGNYLADPSDGLPGIRRRADVFQ